LLEEYKILNKEEIEKIFSLIDDIFIKKIIKILKDKNIKYKHKVELYKILLFELFEKIKKEVFFKKNIDEIQNVNYYVKRIFR